MLSEVSVDDTFMNQRTNGSVNVHIIYGLTISLKQVSPNLTLS